MHYERFLDIVYVARNPIQTRIGAMIEARDPKLLRAAFRSHARSAALAISIDEPVEVVKPAPHRVRPPPAIAVAEPGKPERTPDTSPPMTHVVLRDAGKPIACAIYDARACTPVRRLPDPPSSPITLPNCCSRRPLSVAASGDSSFASGRVMTKHMHRRRVARSRVLYALSEPIIYPARRDGFRQSASWMRLSLHPKNCSRP